jgi:hypothetical protein
MWSTLLWLVGVVGELLAHKTQAVVVVAACLRVLPE